MTSYNWESHRASVKYTNKVRRTINVEGRKYDTKAEKDLPKVRKPW